jgi:hypothetical protein
MQFFNLKIQSIMKKKKEQSPNNLPEKTYKLGRACLYCGEPIEDQARATKTHCSRWIDKFGVVHDCKRKKHKLKTQPQEDILLDFAARQRETHRQILKVLTAHGDYVSTEILDAYNINLADNLGFSFNSGIAVAEFLGFKIFSNPKLKTHKIEPHHE